MVSTLLTLHQFKKRVSLLISLSLTRLPGTLAWFRDLYWLPTGELVFLRDNTIYAIKPDGSGERRLSNLSIRHFSSGENNVSYYSISPDGKKIAYSSVGTNQSLWIANLDGTASIKLSDRFGYHWAWSPDSTKLAFVTQNARPGIGTEIWLVNADASGLQQLIRSADRDEENVYPNWSPDSSVVSFIKRPTIPYDARSGQPQPPSRNELWLVKRDGSTARRLVDTVARFEAHWSPRSSLLAITRQVADKVDNTPATVNSVVIEMTVR